ncbi:YaiI/YqxD family protein [Glaciecola sp. 1036]|uniref:YaiI/YqxD family protein n=1 Tax=Alteromonadaceae TaxID=72275 RepID=UPI003D02DDE1
MKILVDADACPNVIKDILFKAAQRKKIQTLLIANHAISIPPSPYITRLQVASGFDIADNEIVKRAEPDDLVITADIPLADEIISKNALALSPRGELFDKQTIKSRLNTRDFMETMRASGFQTSGPPPLSQKDRKAFADHLDRILARY